MNLTNVAGKRIVVMGLGRFGGQIAVTRFLVEHGAKSVLVTDGSPAEKLASSIEQLKDLPLSYRLGEHRESDFQQADLIVPSPAVPPTNPYLQAASAAGVPLVTEIELSLERLKAAKIIAVTGTKGKSTTTEMLGRMLNAQPLPFSRAPKGSASPRPQTTPPTPPQTHIGGNIGRPLINRLTEIQPEDYVLLELSSYMLHWLGRRHWRPDLALVTMVSKDHLDWHGGEAGYLEAKQNLVRYQRAGDTAVLRKDDPGSAAFAAHTQAQIVWYDGQYSPRFPTKLPGAHNAVNAQGAFAAASQLGVSWDAAAAVMKDFAGLPHRLELVADHNGVAFYNDSIATIPEAAVAALMSFPKNKVHHILGGYDKHLDLSPMVAAIQAHAKSAYCIGALGTSLTQAIGPKATHAGNLTTAVSQARANASPDDIILLSPGCASYDQFPNFEARGESFRQLAQQ